MAIFALKPMENSQTLTIDQSKAGAPVDLVHLSRQTLGDSSLETEILGLFLSQSSLYLDRLRNAKTGDERKLAAHTILGSARGIGAWQVAKEAEAIQTSFVTADSVTPLEDAVKHANAYISSLLD